MHQHIPKFTIGCDPEVFLLDTINKKYVPSEWFFRGYDKKNTLNFGEGFELLCDNVMVEFNTPPAKSLEEFVHNISYAINYIDAQLPPEFTTQVVSEAQFDNETAESCSNFLEFGCAPDYNIYTGKKQKVKLPGNKRFAGGHIHLGFLDEEGNTIHLDEEATAQLVMYLDYFVGLSVNERDPNKGRNTSYGSLGNFRPKPYGLEYRTPSNNWLKNPEEIEFIYTQVQRALEAYNEKAVMPAIEEILQSYKERVLINE